MKTKFKSHFTSSTLEVSYFGDEGLCISITGYGTTLDHVFTLNKGTKRLIKLIKAFTKHG